MKYCLKNNAASKMISSHCVYDCLHDLFLAGFWSLYWVTEIQWSIIESCSLTSLLWWWIDVFFFWSLFSQRLHKSRWLSDLVCFWPLWKWSGLKWRRCQGQASVQVINYVSQLFSFDIFLNTFVSFIPYFHLLVFGILVTLVAWFSFRFFSVMPILPCKM